MLLTGQRILLYFCLLGDILRAFLFQFHLFQLFFEGVTFSCFIIYIYILISYILYKRGCRFLIFNWNNWNWNRMSICLTEFYSLQSLLFPLPPLRVASLLQSRCITADLSDSMNIRVMQKMPSTDILRMSLMSAMSVERT